MGNLESRGFITEGEQSTQSNDPFFKSEVQHLVQRTVSDSPITSEHCQMEWTFKDCLASMGSYAHDKHLQKQGALNKNGLLTLILFTMQT